MNANQIKGAVKDAAGKVQRKTGEVLDSPQQERKGAKRQAEGKGQKAAGDRQQALEHSGADTTSRPRP